jgi:hypothetical protein
METKLTEQLASNDAIDVIAEALKNLPGGVQALEAAEAQAKTDAIEHAKSLGFTDEMINVMYPNLGA